MPVLLVDTHAHLNHEDFTADLPDTIERARSAGVTRMVVPGYDLPSSERAVQLAAQYDGVYAAVGVHPHDAKTFDGAALAQIRQLAAAPKVVAIGEVGLDFHYNFSPPEKQMEAFDAQVLLALDLDLPLIVHTREASSEVLDILTRRRSPRMTGVMHHFSGDASYAQASIGLGFMLGIAGPVTYKKNEEMREVVRGVGLPHLVVETDSPYASPQPVRGKRNEPASVVYVAEKLAELLDLSMEQIAAQTTEAAVELFRIGK